MMIQLRRLAVIAATVALAWATAPADAVAQQSEVMRDVYRFQGSSLEVDVDTESPGRIRFIRGTHSRIEVSGRAQNGFASAALGGYGVRRLTLTSLGADRVDFIVAVPAAVRVRVNWPGARRSELFGTLSDAATYAWETPVARPAFETIRPGNGRSGEPGYMRGTPRRSLGGPTPLVLNIDDADRLERLTIRIEDTPFGVTADRDFTARRDADAVRIAAPVSGDLTILVPHGSRFTVSLDGAPAIIIDRADVRVLCASILSQALPDGRHWLTLTPAAGDGCAPGAPGDRSISPDRRT